MRNLILSVLFIAACGDNVQPPDARMPDPRPPVGPINPGTGCADFDINVNCPKDPDPDPVVDAGGEGSGSDGGEEQPPLTADQHAACCHALLDGTPPNHECGYPPGLCKNGKKDMFCVLPDGTDAKFTLCNP